MPSRTIETIVEGFIFPEGPRWHDGKLCFVDFHSCGVDCVDGRPGFPEAPWLLPWIPDRFQNRPDWV